jgi:tetratricopeptide (TPR) repeat protein
MKRAEDVLVQSQKALAEADAATVLGHLCQAEGDKEGAEKYFLAAARARPADALVLQNLATFYLRSNQFARAEPHLQQMLSLSGKDAEGRRAWARRALAEVYAAGGSYPYFKKALAALDENKKSPGETTDDVRARANVLATRAEHRKEAIGLLKRLTTGQSPREADKWLLARLYDADGDWGQAEVLLLSLVNSPTAKEPAYFAFYVDRLLSRKETARAERWLDKLVQAAPNTLGTKVLRARGLAARDKGAQAVALLREHAAGHEQDLAPAARAVEDLAEGAPDKEKIFRHAEEMYRDLVKRYGKPESHLRLAEFLGRRGRVREALDECERAGSREASQEAVVTAVSALRGGHPVREDYQRVEGWLLAAAKKGQNAPIYLALLADLNDLRGDYRRAIAFNRDALRRSPDNVVVLNNLALLLALSQEGGEEALGYITRAVDVAGPLPALLDTRGTVLLSLGKAELAVPDFERAVALRPTPGGYFRLARARLATNPAAATVAFRQAQQGGLRAESLHPLERDDYRRVLKELAN